MTWSSLDVRREGALRWSLARVRRLREDMLLVGRALWHAARSLYETDNLTFASSIAYYALLSLFPFLLLMFVTLGLVFADEADRGRFLGFVLQYFPRQFKFVTDQLDSLQRASVGLSLVGILVMIWASLGVFGAITSAVNHAWRVEKQPDFFTHKLTSFLMLVAAGVLLALALTVESAVRVAEASWAASAVAHWSGFHLVGNFGVRHSPGLLLISVVGLVFYFVPNATVRFRDVWVGALLTGLLWRGALAGFSWYVHDLSRFSVHGSLAAVVVFLLWVYVSAIILLFGAEFTAAYARLLKRRRDGGK